MAQQNLAALGAALAAGLGTVAPGRAGGWCDNDPANLVDVWKGGRKWADLWDRTDQALLEVWLDGKRLTRDQLTRIEQLLTLAPPGWATVLAERTRNVQRNRRRARVEHRLGLHCGECSPW